MADIQEETIFSPDHREELVSSCEKENSYSIIDGYRLGSYDEYGRYVFFDDIRQELLDMPKFIQEESFDEKKNMHIYLLSCHIPIFDDISFKLTIDKEEAVLYLVEEYIEHETGIARTFEEYLDALALGEKNSYTKEEIFRNYRIFEEDDDEAKELVFSIENILFRKMYLAFLLKGIDEEELLDSEELLDEIMDILKEGGSYGTRILTLFAKEMQKNNQIYNIQSPKRYQKVVMNLLMKTISQVSTKETLANKDNLRVYNKIQNVRNRAIQKNKSQIVKNIDKQELLTMTKNVQRHAVLKQKEEIEEDKILFLTMIGKPLVAQKTNQKLVENKKTETNTSKSTQNDIEKSSRKITAPILKQYKTKEKEDVHSTPQTKEEKIRQIVEGKGEKASKDKTSERVKPAKKPSLSSKGKGASKGKGSSKGKNGKGKIKNAGKVKNAGKEKNNNKGSGKGDKDKGKGGDKPKPKDNKKGKEESKSDKSTSGSKWSDYTGTLFNRRPTIKNKTAEPIKTHSAGNAKPQPKQGEKKDKPKQESKAKDTFNAKLGDWGGIDANVDSKGQVHIETAGFDVDQDKADVNIKSTQSEAVKDNVGVGGVDAERTKEAFEKVKEQKVKSSEVMEFFEFGEVSSSDRELSSDRHD